MRRVTDRRSRSILLKNVAGLLRFIELLTCGTALTKCGQAKAARERFNEHRIGMGVIK
jgi:hypothetical protein